MTRAVHADALAFADVEDVAAALRRAGSRFSAGRRTVLERLFAAGTPTSAEALAAGRPALELSTVYRALETFEHLGVVRHVHLGHGPGLYVLAGTEREYLVCERCDEVRAVEPQELAAVRELIAERFGYQARFGHFPIAGLCPACACGAPAPGPA